MKLVNKVIIVLSLLIVSCNNIKENSLEKSKAEETFEEAIRIHDEVMPKMGKLESLKAELKELKVLKQADSMQIEEQLVKLDEASLAMRMWMHQLKIFPKTNGVGESNGHAGHNSKADTSYQLHLDQKEDIISIQAAINNSIEEAESFLQQ